MRKLIGIVWLALCLLVGPSLAANIEITSLPFDTGGSSGDRYYLTQDLTCTSGVGILVDVGSSEIDGQGHTITISSSSSHGIQLTSTSGTHKVHDIIINRTATGTGNGVIGGSSVTFNMYRVKITQDATGANDYAVRFQGNDTAESCLFVRSVTGTVGNTGASGGWSFINCTFVHVGTTGGGLVSASTSGSPVIKNCIFRAASTAVNIQFSSVSGPTATFSNNIYYRSNNGTVVTYPSGTNYVNGGAGTNVTSLDANAGVSEPNLTGAWVIQSSSVGVIDNGTTGYSYSTDLAGNTRVANGTIDRGAYELQDTTAPTAVSDLACGTPGTTSIPLTWTASGDDAGTGTATSYDLRYSTSTINSGNFVSATAVTGEPTPGTSGASESMTVTGLSDRTTYYFALKVGDEVPNWSAISNVPSATTADGTAPSAIADLAAGAATSSSVVLSWTAPGDDAGTGTATTYDVRYSTSTINAGNFSSATAATGEPSPGASGHAETFTVTGLSAATTYYFAVKTSDEVPNTSSISNVVSKVTASAVGVTAGSFGIDFLEPDE